MKQYLCHKKVTATKMSNIVVASDGTATFVAEDGNTYDLEASFINKHCPVNGGYYVQYEDGYESFSPAAAFEAGYTENTNPVLGATNKNVNIGGMEIHEPVDGVIWLYNKEGEGQTVPEAELTEVLNKYFDSRF